MLPRMKILLLSAYHAASHRYWCDGLQKHFPDFTWTQLALSPRYFAWRVRGNPLSWALSCREVLEHEYDLVVATSMVDLACLRGLIPNLANTPALLYFHENQFAYPLSEQANSIVEAQLTSIYSALSAQKIVFNSEYNRGSFLSGVESLLNRFPDEKPEDLVDTLKAKSCCLSVPLDLSLEESNSVNITPAKRNTFTLDGLANIVWNHRWEYDKGPDRLLALVQKLDPALPLRFHIVGQQFRQEPEAFNDLKAVLIERAWLGTWGYIEERAAYLHLLRDSHFVLSTAVHDFQGLSMLEACALGCVPLAPARLAYPEFFPTESLYISSLEDKESEAGSAAALLEMHMQSWPSALEKSSSIARLLWPQMTSAYRDLFESTARDEVSCASLKKRH